MSIHKAVTNQIRERASLCALGLLEPPESEAFERHLAECDVCRSEVRSFGEVAAEMASCLPESQPASRVREQLLARVAPRGVLIRKGEGAWQATPLPGVEIKPLFFDAATGTTTSLVRMAPGATYPSHRHAGHEHCYVLEGDLVFSDHTLHAGDYEVNGPSTSHSSVTTHVGCLLLLTNNQADQLLV